MVTNMEEPLTRAYERSVQRDIQETTKAVAWAVFQHRNGGGSNRYNGAVPASQATRFKIEALSKRELECCPETRSHVPPIQDASSTLFDAYELDSVFKHLDRALQSVDTHQKVSFDAPKYYDQDQQCYPRHGYGAPEDYDRPEQRFWLESVHKSQQICGNCLDTVDESCPLGDAQDQLGYGCNGNRSNRYEYQSNPKLELNLDMYDELCKDVQEVLPQGKLFKTMQFLQTRSWGKVLQGRTRHTSFDSSSEVALFKDNKDNHQSKSSKLRSIFSLKTAKGSLSPRSTRQARIVPDDYSQKGRKSSEEGDLKKIGFGPYDDDSSDSAHSDGYEAQYVSPTKTKTGSRPAHNKQVLLSPVLKSSVQMVTVPNVCRTVRLSSDMRNPDPAEGLRDHLRHGSLAYNTPVLLKEPRERRKSSYSLNSTPSLGQKSRRAMLHDDRDDFEQGNSSQYLHEHHHHVLGEVEDNELTVQDIVKRASRKSFDEIAHRMPIGQITGLKLPKTPLVTAPASVCNSPSMLFL